MSKHHTRREERKIGEDSMRKTIEDTLKHLAESSKEAFKASPERVEKRTEHLKFTLEPEDATRISSLLYEECDRGLIKEVRINVTPAPQCIVMDLLITIITRVTSELAIRGLGRLNKKIEKRTSKREEES